MKKNIANGVIRTHAKRQTLHGNRLHGANGARSTDTNASQVRLASTDTVSGMDQQQHDFMEVFSMPRIAPKFGKHCRSLDKLNGWDLTDKEKQEACWQLINMVHPRVTFLSPPCTAFSTIMNLA